MKNTYAKVEKKLIKKEDDLLKSQKAAPALKDQIAEHYSAKQASQIAKVEDKASRTVEYYKNAQQQEKDGYKRNLSRFNKRVSNFIEAYAKDSYNSAVKKVLLSEDKEVKGMKILAKAKLKDIEPKRQVATQKTRLYKTVNRERKPVWDSQKVGTGIVGAVALGGLATAMAVSAFEGRPVDHEVAAVTTFASMAGMTFGASLGTVARDTAANNKGHRLVQAFYEMKAAKQMARLEAIKDVQSGEVKAEEVLNEKEMRKYEGMHAKVDTTTKEEVKDFDKVDVEVNNDNFEDDNSFSPEA